MELGKDVIIGVSVNNTMGITGKVYGLSELIEASQEAEAMGFDAIWVHDGMTGRRTSAAFDPTNVLTAVAAKTKRLLLATGVYIPHIRNPIHVAQAWATLWEVSEGRAIMGAGTGAGKDRIVQRQYGALAAVHGGQGHPLDWETLFKRRTGMFGECLDIMNRLWTEDKFSYDGKHYKFDEITLGIARPEEKPPVLVGGGIYIPQDGVGAHHYTWNKDVAGTFMMGPKIRQVVAEQGDGWLYVHSRAGEYNEIQAELLDIAKDNVHGRAPRVLARNQFVNIDDDPRKAWENVQNQLTDFHGAPPGQDKCQADLVDRWAVAGPGKAVAAQLQEHIDHGVSVFQCVIASPDQQGMMKRIAEEVLPHIDKPRLGIALK